MGWGTIAAAAPAVIQGVSSLFGSGRSKKPKKISTLSPEQRRLHQEYIQGIRGEGPMAGMFNFNPDQVNQNFESTVARPAYRQFQEDVIPQITGQFRGKNLMNSSYTGEALGRAGRNVQESLDAQRSNTLYNAEQSSYDRRNQAIQNALSTQTFAYQRPQERSSPLDSILNGLSNVSGQYIADQYRKYLNPPAS